MKQVRYILSSIFYFVGIFCILLIMGIEDITNIPEGLRSIGIIVGIGASAILVGYVLSNPKHFKYQMICIFAVVATFTANTFYLRNDDSIFLRRIYRRCGSYGQMYRYCMYRAYHKEVK